MRTCATHLLCPGGCMQLDLSIAIDSSGSMGQTGWNTSLDFSLSLLRRVNVSSECVRVSMLSFGTEGYLHSMLADGTSLSSVTSVVSAMRFKQEWTNTGAAIKLMTEQVFSVDTRENVLKLGLIITDGPSNREQQHTVPNAQVSQQPHTF